MNIMKFAEWLKIKEMCGTGAIYDPKAKGEVNWWGAPQSMGPHKKKKKKKK